MGNDLKTHIIPSLDCHVFFLVVLTILLFILSINQSLLNKKITRFHPCIKQPYFSVQKVKLICLDFFLRIFFFFFIDSSAAAPVSSLVYITGST